MKVIKIKILGGEVPQETLASAVQLFINCENTGLLLY